MPDTPVVPATRALDPFHPAVAAWFRRALGEPTPAQARAWEAIRAGQHALVAAPTGSGKTLAAFLAAIDDLVRRALDGDLPEETRVLYLSPLKALSNDIDKNLQLPLAGIADEAARLGLQVPVLRTQVRTGDTPAAARQAAIKRPPHIFVTTPESLYILLTSEGGRRMLAGVRTVIVDEIHALVGDKRGAHLALSLERLAALVERRGGHLQRIGLSATQRPIDAVARFLVGDRPEPCAVIDAGLRRALDLAIEVPPSPLEAVLSGAQWHEIADRIAALAAEHRTTLVFVNTRRLAEKLARTLGDKLGKDLVATHHGSLSRDQRLRAEQRLKSGDLRVLVATASLELGIDIGAVELVCQLGSPRSLSALLQRVGRAAHVVGGLPKGRIFPQSRDDLCECTAALLALRRGELDLLEIPPKPLDVLAQQIVAMAATDELREDELLALVRRADPYRGLDPAEFDALLDMLADGFATRRGRRGALIHRDRVGGLLRGRRGAGLTAIQNGGAIPDTADFEVVREPDGVVVGGVHEDFAIESMAGDVFQLGTNSWRVLKVDPGKVRVEDAQGAPPTIPFWLGEAPGRSAELSAAVARLRGEVGERALAGGPDRAIAWLTQEAGLSEEGARQLVEYLAAAQQALGAMPTQDTLVAERFFDEAGGMQLVLHAPFGARVNRAWGLSLRKRFCRTFNFELQAAATDDAIVISLGAVHSFPLADVFAFLRGPGVRDILVQALLDAPMFTVRWRWNTSRALAVPRRRGGKRLAPQIQRMLAEDLAAVVFPDQGACLENIAGDREIPDHPLVQQTIDDCLREAMDIDRFLALVAAIDAGQKRLVAVDRTEPSPLAHEILRARPYAFLDDAPLEERRTLAVVLRRTLGPDEARGLGALDPAVIAEIRRQVWPAPRSADELHDALHWLGYLTEEEGHALPPADPQTPAALLLDHLAAAGRAARLTTPQGARLWITAERLPQLRAVYDLAEAPPHASPLADSPHSVPRSTPLADSPHSVPRSATLADSTLADSPHSSLPAHGPGDPLTALTLTLPAPSGRPRAALGPPPPPPSGRPRAALAPPLTPPPALDRPWEPEPALVEIVRSRLEGLGPVTAARLAAEMSLETSEIEAALIALESEGFALRGHFTRDASTDEFCERGLLARIHRGTLHRLRQEIAPVAATDFVRFLLAWHQITADPAPRGPEALAAALARLEGIEAPAAAWEEELLPARLHRHDPHDLDGLCMAGALVWVRLGAGPGRRGPVRSTPIALLPREHAGEWTHLSPRTRDTDDLSADARALQELLTRRGALFFGELVAQSRLLRAQVEDALGELVARGLVSSDSFAGLRALIGPGARRPRPGARPPRPGFGPMDRAGRWALVPEGHDDAHAPHDDPPTPTISPPPPSTTRPGDLAHTESARAPDSPHSPAAPSRRELALRAVAERERLAIAERERLLAERERDDAATEHIARVLLRRYGVVFRGLLARERGLPPWRDLVRVFRRLEAAGELRGGYFVDSAAAGGEHFALPEAVGLLRSARKGADTDSSLVCVAASDPLCLLGVLLPGERLPALLGNRLLYRAGAPIAVLEAGRIRHLLPPTEAEAPRIARALTHGPGLLRDDDPPITGLRRSARPA